MNGDGEAPAAIGPSATPDRADRGSFVGVTVKALHKLSADLKGRIFATLKKIVDVNLVTAEAAGVRSPVDDQEDDLGTSRRRAAARSLLSWVDFEAFLDHHQGCSGGQTTCAPSSPTWDTTTSSASNVLEKTLLELSDALSLLRRTLCKRSHYRALRGKIFDYLTTVFLQGFCKTTEELALCFAEELKQAAEVEVEQQQEDHQEEASGGRSSTETIQPTEPHHAPPLPLAKAKQILVQRQTASTTVTDGVARSTSITEVGAGGGGTSDDHNICGSSQSDSNENSRKGVSTVPIAAREASSSNLLAQQLSFEASEQDAEDALPVMPRIVQDYDRTRWKVTNW
eukprot:g17799.t1